MPVADAIATASTTWLTTYLQVGPAQLATMLKAGATIASDFERGQALKALDDATQL